MTAPVTYTLTGLPLGATFDADTATLEWSQVESATKYDVVRGNLGSLRRAEGDFEASMEVCTTTAMTMFDDPEIPLRGDGYWYLVRGQNACGTGSAGVGSQLPRTLPATGCD